VRDTIVVGLGNLLLKDDGVGVHTIQALEKEALPPTVELVDGGTSTLNLLSYFMGCPKIIIIDALQAGLPPGTIYRLTPEDIPRYRAEHLSIHDVQILDVVKMAALLGGQPEVVILGIEPLEIASGLELTPVIEERIPALVQSVIRELSA
jgi:hydrogenase maturation protease